MEWFKGKAGRTEMESWGELEQIKWDGMSQKIDSQLEQY